ncbi:hypothetical protein ACFWGM_38320, partial [Streptomyces roseolus]|uniref:hypothetical protein n=1 Tax=Streptomyces roseolus TaxID=67358 RepID=UPI003648BF5A
MLLHRPTRVPRTAAVATGTSVARGDPGTTKGPSRSPRDGRHPEAERGAARRHDPAHVRVEV